MERVQKYRPLSAQYFFDIMRKHGYDSLLKVPFSRQKLDIVGFGFVDNTDLVQTGLSCDEYWDIATKLQSAVELWREYTEMSEVCVVPAKSWWTLVDFTWYDRRWEYSTNINDVAIDFKNDNGQRRELEQLSASEVYKTLRVWPVPDDNNTQHVEEMSM